MSALAVIEEGLLTGLAQDRVRYRTDNLTRGRVEDERERERHTHTHRDRETERERETETER